MLGQASLSEISPFEFPLWVKAVFPLSVPEPPPAPQNTLRGKKCQRGAIRALIMTVVFSHCSAFGQGCLTIKER